MEEGGNKWEEGVEEQNGTVKRSWGKEPHFAYLPGEVVSAIQACLAWEI